MSESVKRVIRKSSHDFLAIVWPKIGTPFGQIIPVETVSSNDFAKELDARSGIDNWLVGVDGHMRGLASRVQWTDSSYGTFTIRMRTRYGHKTEYHKRKLEIATDGAIRPHYVCQAYVSLDRARLVACAVACMRDVIAAIDDEVGWLMKPNPDGTQGWAVPWQALVERGKPIQIWPEASRQEPLPLDYDWPPVAKPGGGDTRGVGWTG